MLQEEKEKIKVLLVEPDPENMTELEEMVKREELEPIKCTDGFDALMTARREKPSVILSEANITGMDGFAVCRLLKFDDRYRDIKFIFLTHLLGHEYEEYSNEAGADEFIEKPCDVEDILPKIQSAVGRCRWIPPKTKKRPRKKALQVEKI